MKKFIAFLVVLTITVTSAVCAYAQINISINGEIVDIPKDMGAVMAKDNRTFVPVRFILENFGYKVEYIQDGKQIMGADENGNFFAMQIGSPYLFFKASGETETTKVTMDVSPFVDWEEGRVYVPARFLATEIGYNVDYDAQSQTVIMTNK